MIYINTTVSITASAQSVTASIDFDVPVIDAFTSVHQAKGMAVAEMVGSQESHPARISAIEGSKRVRMTWWSATTNTVQWSITIGIFDTGDV